MAFSLRASLAETLQMSQMGQDRSSGDVRVMSVFLLIATTSRTSREVVSGHKQTSPTRYVQMTPTTLSQRNASDTIVSCMSAMTIRLRSACKIV
jgi:hypothetical protein